MVKVLDLNTGKYLIYSGITPAEAVVAAHEQSKGNFNTWSYDFTQAKVGPSGMTVLCGDFSAMLEN